MKSSKIFALPSTREGFGIVVLEANACGLPVVTTNHPDNASRNLIEEGKNGYLSQPTEKSLVSYIIKSLDNKSVMNSSQAVLRYSWDNIIPKVIKAYR